MTGRSAVAARLRVSGLAAWDALLGGVEPGLTCVYGPDAAASTLVYEMAKAMLVGDAWSSDVAAVGVGLRRRQAATVLGETSAALFPLERASMDGLRRVLDAVRGGVIVLDDVGTVSLHLGLTRPSRTVAAEFESLIASADAAGTSILAIGRLDAAGRPAGGGLWSALRTATVRLRAEGATPLGDFRAELDFAGFSGAALSTHGAVPRSLCIDRSGVTLTELPARTVVNVRVD